MKKYRVSGSEAYAPLPVEQPSHLPEEPKKRMQTVERPAGGISAFTVAGTAVALVLVFCVLFSMVRLFEVRSENAELQRQQKELKTQQELLRAQYESAIDLDTVAKRAEELGMHLPWAEQIEYLTVELPEPVEQTAERVKTGVFAAFQSLAEDMQAYFS